MCVLFGFLWVFLLDCSVRHSNSPKSCKKIRTMFKRYSKTSSAVSRRLGKEFGLNSHGTARKPHLTPVMKKRRRETGLC